MALGLLAVHVGLLVVLLRLLANLVRLRAQILSAAGLGVGGLAMRAGLVAEALALGLLRLGASAHPERDGEDDHDDGYADEDDCPCDDRTRLIHP